MPYKVKFEFAPSHELLASFSIFIKRNLSRHLLCGDQWIKEVESKIGDKFKEQLQAFEDPGCWIEYMVLLAYIRENKKETAKEFLQWVESIQPGELFELLSSYVRGPIQPQIGELKSQFVGLLYKWNELYFEKFNSSLLKLLQEESKVKSALIGKLSSTEVVESVTDLWIEEEANIDKMVLVPSIHVNPIKFIYKYNNLNIIHYPVDPPTGENEVPHRIRRITKALNDDNRVRMLKLIAKEPKTFTDLVNEIGLSKATVHQHLFVLRSAGLLRTHYYHDFYTINPKILDKISNVLSKFIFQE